MKDLIQLAQCHENIFFFQKPDGQPRDPAFFMHQYLLQPYKKTDIEIVAFLSASLAFGQRQKILEAIQKILNEIKKENLTPTQWVKSGNFTKLFPDGKEGYYYRTFSNQNLHNFFLSLKNILDKNESIGDWLKNENPENIISLIAILISRFNCSPLIPKNTESACKRICLFLRWMVRKTEVDIGLWDFVDKKDLIIPLDTHVIQSSKKLGILQETSIGKSINASMKNALKVTEAMRKIFPNDPCKGDFALFGADVKK